MKNWLLKKVSFFVILLRIQMRIEKVSAWIFFSGNRKEDFKGKFSLTVAVLRYRTGEFVKDDRER